MFTVDQENHFINLGRETDAIKTKNCNVRVYVKAPYLYSWLIVRMYTSDLDLSDTAGRYLCNDYCLTWVGDQVDANDFHYTGSL